MDPELQKIFDAWAAEELAVRIAIVFQLPMFTANSVPGPNDRPVPATLIRRWRRERRIFGARFRGRDYFPAFQFENGQPRPWVRQVLELLHPFTNWETMFWFAGANGWLENGAAPVSVLGQDVDAIIEAARHANDRISD